MGYHGVGGVRTYEASVFVAQSSPRGHNAATIGSAKLASAGVCHWAAAVEGEGNFNVLPAAHGSSNPTTRSTRARKLTQSYSYSATIEAAVGASKFGPCLNHLYLAVNRHRPGLLDRLRVHEELAAV